MGWVEMGWTFYHRDKGETNAQHFGKDWDGYTILADSTVKGVWYAAVRRDATGEVFAAVHLIQWVPKDYYNFGYKGMTEDWGPGDTEAPAKVLDLLTPTTNEYALQWREACRATLAAKAAAKAARKAIRSGDVVTFEQSLSFGHYGTGTRFRYTGSKNTFASIDLGIRVNLGTGWPTRPHTIEPAVAVTA